MLPVHSGVALHVILLVSSVVSLRTLNLDGSWRFQDTERNFEDGHANVPSGIYTDLMENNVIGDVFFKYRDVEYRWVAAKNWTYYRTFTVDEVLASHQNIKLVFDGLDTYSSIFVNNRQVGVTDNMFVQYIFDISQSIQLGSNMLEVRFTSPIAVAKYLFNEQAKRYIVPPTCVPDEYRGECHVNHMRKMQASFSWDWGPAFPSVGIWKSVRIEAYNSTTIRDVTVTMTPDDQANTWDITVNTYFDNNVQRKLYGNLIIRLQTDIDTVETIHEVALANVGNGEMVHGAMFTIPKLHVKLWWPNGYGNPQLYLMSVIFQGVNGETSTKNMNVGFRTVSLVQNQIGANPESGLSFYFVVNNVPIFAKGTNSIPLNVLPEKGYNSSTIQFLLQSAKAVHMNMIRVWGGGVYESDEFYNVADELGILIWQDFMFACAMYPVNNGFLSSVKQEVRHQVRRLQHHPSIILWAGNNENEAALRQNWYGTEPNFEQYKADYIKLYVDTIRPEVFANDDSRQFLTSSPTNGLASENEGYIATNPASSLFGDVHYYDYFTDSWDQGGYPTPRFSSEYGLQSFPSFSTLMTATNDSLDLVFNSEFLNHRQHHPNGNEEMLALMGMRLPLMMNGPNFNRAYLFYTQIHQAMGMKLQTEKYRIWRSALNSVQQGFTMGALYWQLNDVWVAPTWSGIDFNLNWKMLHYFAKRFFSPILLAGYQSSARKVTISVVSDLLTNIYNATIFMSVYKWDSFEPIHVETHNVNIMSGLSSSITGFWIDTALAAAQCGTIDSARYNCFLHLALRDGTGQNILAPDNFIFPAPLKDSALTRSNVQINFVTQVTKNGLEFDIQLLTDSPALFVWLEANGIPGIFSDNGFLMVTKTTVIKFYPGSPVTAEQLKTNLAVTHLMDPLYF